MSSTVQMVRSSPTLNFADVSMKTLGDACMRGALDYSIDRLS